MSPLREVNAPLEASFIAAPDDPAPALVYADWLSERGADALATALRVLGGTGDDSARDVQEVAVLAVASANWLVSSQSGPDDDDGAVAGFFGTTAHVISACAKRLAGKAAVPAVDAPTGAAKTPRHEALASAIRSLRQGEFTSAARQARSLAPPAGLLRLIRMLHGRAFVADPGIAQALARGPGKTDLEPLPAREQHPFSFDHVILTNNTAGVEGRVLRGSGFTPGQAFLSLAAHLEGLTCDAWDALTPDERGDFGGELGIDDEARWQPTSHFDALSTLFGLLAANEGHGVRVGPTERPLLDVLDELGPFISGAQDTSDFPWTVLEFEGAWVALHVVY